MSERLTTADLGKLRRESSFQAEVMEHARAAGWTVLHFNDSRRQIGPGVFVGDRQAKGWPDLVLLRPGEALFRELKRDNTYPNPRQREVMGQMAEAGLDVAVWRPRDWDEIERRLWASAGGLGPAAEVKQGPGRGLSSRRNGGGEEGYG